MQTIFYNVYNGKKRFPNDFKEANVLFSNTLRHSQFAGKFNLLYLPLGRAYLTNAAGNAWLREKVDGVERLEARNRVMHSTVPYDRLKRDIFRFNEAGAYSLSEFELAEKVMQIGDQCITSVVVR